MNSEQEKECISSLLRGPASTETPANALEHKTSESPLGVWQNLMLDKCKSRQGAYHKLLGLGKGPFAVVFWPWAWPEMPMECCSFLR